MLEQDSIPIAKIRIDGGTQLRVETDKAVVREYAEALRQADAARRKTLFPRIRLVWEESSDTYWLVDGFHRLHAHKEAGLEEIEADIEEGDLTLAKLRACGANLDHGLRRSNETKRNVVREALGNALTTGWSNQRIAELCGVSAPFVGSMREALGLTPSKVQGKNGKTYHLADKLTEAHIFACPSLAQVEDWCRQHGSSPLGDVLRRYRQHLVSIEQPTTLAALDLRWSYGLANAALKGPGVIKALALRIEALLHEAEAVGEARPSWEDDLARVDSVSGSWALAFDPAIVRTQREQALLAWAQWSDGSVSYPRETAVTELLRTRWDRHREPRPPSSHEQTKARISEHLSAMDAAGLEELRDKHSYALWNDRELHEKARLRAIFLGAHHLIEECADPLCRESWFQLTRGCNECRRCHRPVETATRIVQQEADRTDRRRAVEHNPLSLMLVMLQSAAWKDDDEEALFWHRVAAWRDAGCPGLPLQDARDLDEGQDLDDEGQVLDGEDAA